MIRFLFPFNTIVTIFSLLTSVPGVIRQRTMAKGIVMASYDEVDLYSGLAALHWSAYDDPALDHDFYKRVVEQAGGLALDVACGAGRLLRRYLKAGLAVEGVDSSADMLAVCTQKAEAEGLSSVLYCQPMQALDLPKRYACIYVPCGSFTCVMGQDNALEALRRFRHHLLPGGVLAFNTFWGDWEDFDYNDPAKKRSYPTDWRPHVIKELGGPRRLVVERRTTGVDPVEQVVSEQRRYRLYDGDDLLQEEIHAGQNHWYFKKEMLLMLRLAGFEDVQVKGDYTDEDFGPQHTGTMVFVCHKPLDQERTTIKGSRVVLRALSRDDLPRLHQFNNDVEVVDGELGRVE